MSVDFSINKRTVQTQLGSLLSRDLYSHMLFWFVFYAILVVLDGEPSLTLRLGKEFVNVVFFAAIVYVNLHYLIPKYLSKSHLLWYLCLLILVAVLITPIKTLVYYLLYSNDPGIQNYFILHQASLFLSTFFVGIISTAYKISSDWVFHQREVIELEHRTLESELNFLKSQINPHFLFNTLNNLYALTLKKSDKAPEIVLRLSEMMRYMLYECNERRVTLEKEIKYLQNYLELEKLRQGKKMDISFSFDGEFNNKKIAPLMFIPFVENCFKHGASNQITEGYVDVTIKSINDEVSLTARNSKVSSLPSFAGRAKSGGIGLTNIRKRLSLLYQDKHLLEVEDEPNDYTVKLLINLND